MLNTSEIDRGDYVEHSIFDSDLTGPTEREIKEILADVMREQGINLNVDFGFSISVIWGVQNER
jgi:hypothetical protein